METETYIKRLDAEGPVDPSDKRFSDSIRKSKIERFARGKAIAEDLNGRPMGMCELADEAFYHKERAAEVQRCGGCCGNQLAGRCLHSPGHELCPRFVEARDVSSFVDQLTAWLEEKDAQQIPKEGLEHVECHDGSSSPATIDRDCEAANAG